MNSEKYESITEFLQSMRGKMKAVPIHAQFSTQNNTSSYSSEIKKAVSENITLIMAIVPEIVLILLIVCAKLLYKLCRNGCVCKIRDIHVTKQFFILFRLEIMVSVEID